MLRYDDETAKEQLDGVDKTYIPELINKLEETKEVKKKKPQPKVNNRTKAET